MALACMLPGLRDMTGSAHADPPRYRIVPLEPDSTDILAQCRVLGINNRGQVTGFVHVQIDSEFVPRAFVWVPHEVTIDSVVYPTGVLTILLHPGESIEELDPRPSVGRAINEHMQIVGAVAAVIDETIQPLEVMSSGIAYMWIPEEALPEQGTQDLWPAREMAVLPHGLPNNDESIWSDAWDLTDMADDRVRIVGTRAALTATTAERMVVGAIFDGCTVDFQVCLVSPGPSEGGSSLLQSPPWTLPIFGNRAAEWEPAWTLSAMDHPDEFLPNSSQSNAAFARAVNDAEDAAGGGIGEVTDPEVYSCLTVPLFWGAAQSTPQILPTPVNEGTPEQGWANALNNFAPAMVVGRNETVGAAAMWEVDFTSSNWTYNDLNDAVFTNISACGWERLIEAFDINDGVLGSRPWIAGYGSTATDPALFHGFVLVPIDPCDADVDGTPGIGFGDLLILIGSYGSCPVNEVCWLDLDGDCDVDFADQLLLMSYFESCTGESMQSGTPVEDALLSLWLALGGMEALQTGQITPARFNELVLTTPLIDGVIALFSELNMDLPESGGES
ncbi:MAG: hypothetical protein KF817_16060 [Phycisphaeraceae bacterium]|nr:hypothetical protein [Phycisphaeraceae bacterium]